MFDKAKKYKFQDKVLRYIRATAYYVFFNCGAAQKKFKIGSKNYDLIREIKIAGLKFENKKLRQREQKHVEKIKDLEKQLKKYKSQEETLKKYERLKNYMYNRDISLSDILHRNLISEKPIYQEFYKIQLRRNNIAHPKIEKIKSDQEFIKTIKFN